MQRDNGAILGLFRPWQIALLIAMLLFVLIITAGCAINKNVVAVGTGTSIGVDISQDVSGMYHAKMGYNRGELFFVPTTNEYCPDVLAEIQFRGIFSKDGGIYQRLAVGATAVSQPGAVAMFAKDASGKLDPEVLAGVTRPDPKKADLARAYLSSSDQEKWNQAAVAAGYGSFAEFLGAENADVGALVAELKKLGLLQ